MMEGGARSSNEGGARVFRSLAKTAEMAIRRQFRLDQTPIRPGAFRAGQTPPFRKLVYKLVYMKDTIRQLLLRFSEDLFYLI